MLRKSLFGLFVLALSAAPAFAADYSVGALKIHDPWARATPKGAPVGGGYLTITNTGTAPDRLVGGATDVSKGF
ncbi:MAG TPA: copper chaperone PCu(A)C, partial [Stellaceae bacterium]